MNQMNVLRRFPGLIFVATPIGSPGKTTVSQTIEYVLLERNLFVDLYSFGSSSRDNVSKLKRVLPRTVDIPFGASMREIADNPELAVQHFDKTGALMSHGGALFDFGANVAPAFFSWGPVSGLYGLYGRLPPITLVVPVTASSVSIDGVFEIVRDARKALKNLPVQNVIIVHNERDGDFTGNIPGLEKLRNFEKGLETELKVTSIKMPMLPRINAVFWDKIQNEDLAFRDVIAKHPAELGKLFGISGLQCSRGVIALEKWLEDLVSAYSVAGLIG